MNKAEFQKTIGGQILQSFREELSKAIEVPNSLLPESLHSKRGYRTLSSIQRICKIEEEKISQHKIEKAIKARNVERLAAQVEAMTVKNGNNVDINGELDYSQNEIDDIKLYRNQAALVGGMINGGVIDADDLMDE